MALRSVCLWGVLLLAPTLWTLGVCQDGGATQTISVGFIGDEFSGKEGDEIVASVKVEVPKDFDLDDFNETLTIVVTSKDGEAEAGRDFELLSTIPPLTREELKKIQDSVTGHRLESVEISLTEDDYIEKIQKFTLTLEVESALDVVEEHTQSATFIIHDRESDRKSVEISFEQTTYTAYASEGTPLKVKVLKTGHIRQDIAVDVTFSNGQTTQTISFDPLQTVMEVSFIPESDTTISLALAEPSQNIVEPVVFGAPAEVKVMNFTPEGSQIVMVLKGLLEEKYNELEKKYEALQKTIGLAVWFDQNDYPVRESDRTVRVCLRKNLETSEVISVTVTAKESSPASATGGEDFSIAPTKITIPAGSEGTACTDIDITDDSVALEGDETFTLTLTVDDHRPPVTSSATVTIIDDDGVEVNLDDTVLAPFEENVVHVCVNKNATTKGSLKVPLEWPPANPSSEPANTQPARKASVTFSGDEIVSCVNITMTDFPIILIIGKLPEDHVVAGNSKATVYAVIITINFKKEEYTAKEGGDPVSVCVETSAKLDKDFDVAITSADVKDSNLTIHKNSEKVCTDIDITKIKTEFTVALERSQDTPDNVVIVHPSKAIVTITKSGATNASPAPVTTNASDPTTDTTDTTETPTTDNRIYVWVVVVVIVIIGVAVAAYIIYHQRTKLKNCLTVEEQGGKGRRGRYKKLPANIREALHQD